MIHSARCGGRRNGMALIMTVMVVALLTTLVFERFNDAWIAAALASSFRNETKSYFAARSGQEAGKLIMQEDARINPSFDALTEEWAQGTIPIPIDNEFCFVSIRDESGKLDLNQLASERGYPDDRWIAVFRRLLTTLELDPALADVVVDWIDSNGSPRATGAEDGYYLSLERPYPTKNRRFDSLGELTLLKGFTPEVLAKLQEHVTVWSSGKININTATPEVLRALHPGVTEEMARAIATRRLIRPFKQRTDIKQVPGMAALSPEVALLIDVRSDFFSVESTATFDETTRTIRAVYRRTAHSSSSLFYKAL